MMPSPVIFRNYDIRGAVPYDLDELSSEAIGRAFGSFIQGRFGDRVVVGHDNRESSAALKDKFVYGLMLSGCKVVDIGLSLTPIVQYLTFDKRFDAGAMVTASHNPKEYNGFRLIGKNSEPIYGDGIKAVQRIVESKEFKKGSGSLDYADLSEDYVNFLSGLFKFEKPLRVLVDCGNGTSSAFATRILTSTGTVTDGLYCNLDAEYPHGIPDPENNVFMKTLSENVTQGSYDIGFAFDTDADRLGVVDEKGSTYTTDKILLLFAWDVLPRNKGKRVVFDVKSSEVLFGEITRLHGVPEMIRTGHPYFIRKIRSGEAVVGAEFAGHTFLGENYFGYDDGIYAALKVVEIVGKSGSTLSKLMEQFPRSYNTDEVKLYCEEEEKKELYSRVTSLVSSKQFEKVVNIDGIRAYLDKSSWLLVRTSNTSPYLSLRFEADTKGKLEESWNTVLSVLPRLGRLDASKIFYR